MAKIRIGEIIDRVLAYNDRADADLLRSAYIYSGVVHRGQMRQSGEPYLIHPLAVAEILTQLRMDEVTIAAGLLHDTVEDTHATIEDIAEQCGEDVARLVDGVTKISAINFKTKEERQAENFRKLVLAMSQDIRVLMIKLADRLHN
ncbi:MAG: bifunctional (p)ppGpp synthetase/guanosine-3',5'-bis(diphosphate) 3'-pyrophosphohydrolase, partial [Myxococcales bacterium]|nr:bifunctional (p)ppGpp synthetase/guanosine-3',5'-bis(diphosphate) 3'-pyrophosphohydrolase [Myxococcales bacterium]